MVVSYLEGSAFVFMFDGNCLIFSCFLRIPSDRWRLFLLSSGGKKLTGRKLPRKSVCGVSFFMSLPTDHPSCRSMFYQREGAILVMRRVQTVYLRRFPCPFRRTEALDLCRHPFLLGLCVEIDSLFFDRSPRPFSEKVMGFPCRSQSQSFFSFTIFESRCGSK